MICTALTPDIHVGNIDVESQSPKGLLEKVELVIGGLGCGEKLKERESERERLIGTETYRNVKYFTNISSVKNFTLIRLG